MADNKVTNASANATAFSARPQKRYLPLGPAEASQATDTMFLPCWIRRVPP